MQGEGAVAICLCVVRINDVHAPCAGATGVQRLCLDCGGRRHALPYNVQL